MANGKPPPPPPWLQKLNSFLHVDPAASSIAYAAYWIVVLSIGIPIAVVALLARTAVQLASLAFDRLGSGRRGSEYYSPSTQRERYDLAVVVTGCDSGFGKAIAVDAAEAGYTVFAGCLTAESFGQFREHPRVIPFKLDVTNDEDVANAFEKVEKWRSNDAGDGSVKGSNNNNSTTQRVLHALVNNAGIATELTADLTDLSMFQKFMDVNFFGVVRCCKAFLPIFKDQAIHRTYDGSRIINLTSIAAVIPAAAGSSCYGSSKRAAQSFSQCLRAELVAYNVQVSTVNPTFHSTPMASGASKKLKQLWDGLSAEKRDEYGQGMRAV